MQLPSNSLQPYEACGSQQQQKNCHAVLHMSMSVVQVEYCVEILLHAVDEIRCMWLLEVLLILVSLV